MPHLDQTNIPLRDLLDELDVPPRENSASQISTLRSLGVCALPGSFKLRSHAAHNGGAGGPARRGVRE